MKKVIFALVVFFIVLKLVEMGQEKVKEKVWTPPLSEAYPLINQISKKMDLSKGGFLSQLDDTGKIFHIISHQRAALHQELTNAVQAFPENEAVEKVAIMTFGNNISEVDMLETLIGNHEESNRSQKGKISRELQRVWKQHLQEKEALLRSMQDYYTALGTKARNSCEVSDCNPAYVRISELSQMAYLLQRTGKAEEAIDYLQLGIDNLYKLEENDREQMRQDLHTSLGLVYLQLGRDDEAVDELHASEPKEVTFDIAINGWSSDLAFPLYEKGKRDAALLYWKDAITFWEEQAAREKDEDTVTVYKRSAKFARKRYEEMKTKKR